MKKRTVRPLLALLFCNFLLIVSARPQDIVPTFKLEIKGHGEVTLFGYMVTLHSLGNAPDSLGPAMESGDMYVFRNVPTGDYSARIVNAAGEVVADEMIRVTGSTPVIEIHLRRQEKPQPGAGRVSINELRNPPAPKAYRAFMAARKYSKDGHPEKAAAHLEEAIRISPSYAEAYTNLAAMHIRMGQFERAIEVANRAMRIGSPNMYDLSNRALAEWALARHEAAMQSAEEALRLDGNAVTAHLVLGALQAGNPDTLSQAICHLERAAERYPYAAKLLEQVRP